MRDISLRDVTEGDLPQFFEHQTDPVANHMVAFMGKDAMDWNAFQKKWSNILCDDTSSKSTIVFDGQVVGNVLCFIAPWSGRQEVGFWIGREFWGRGIATQALSLFLAHVKFRPLYAGVVKDNLASIRVLEKCGFVIIGQGKQYSHTRGEEVDELILELRATAT